jgi:hypothetical protein
MDDFKKEQGAEAVYAKPAIKDYGTVQELTAAGGSKFQDVPIGTPIGDVTASSTP